REDEWNRRPVDAAPGDEVAHRSLDVGRDENDGCGREMPAGQAGGETRGKRSDARVDLAAAGVIDRVRRVARLKLCANAGMDTSESTEQLGHDALRGRDRAVDVQCSVQLAEVS